MLLSFFFSSKNTVNSETTNLSPGYITGQTPLQEAARWGREKCVQTLLEAGVDKEARNNGGASALFMATINNQLPVVKMLIEAGCNKYARDNSGETVLHVAAENGCLAIVQYLVKTGLSPYDRNMRGMTPVDRARQNSHHEVEMWLSKLTCSEPLEASRQVAVKDMVSIRIESQRKVKVASLGSKQQRQ